VVWNEPRFQSNYRAGYFIVYKQARRNDLRTSRSHSRALNIVDEVVEYVPGKSTIADSKYMQLTSFFEWIHSKKKMITREILLSYNSIGGLITHLKLQTIFTLEVSKNTLSDLFNC